MTMIPVPNDIQRVMQIIPIGGGSQYRVRGGYPTLRDYSNGQIPGAGAIRETSDMLHTLLARRGRHLFSKYVKTWYTTADLTDRTTLRFACHTGPFATTVRIVTVGYPASSFASGDSKAWWVSETGLTGSGTTSTGSIAYSTGLYTANAVSNMWTVTQEFTVTRDQDYRFTLHQVNAFAVVSVSAFEVARPVLDTTADTLAIDTTEIAALAPITSDTANSILALSDKLWRRGGHSLWCWSVDGATPLGITASTAANILDGTTTPTSTTMGQIVQVPYAGSLDSSAVACVLWLNAYVSNALATGTVTLRDQTGTILGTISVTGTSATWYSTTVNLVDGSGGVPTTRLELYASVTATYTLNVHAFGCFMYKA